MMKKTTVLIIFLVLLISCKSSPQEEFPELEGKYATYSGEEGWKIIYPHNWLVKFPENNDVAFYAPKSEKDIDAGIGIRVLEIKKGTIDDLEKDIQQKTKTIERKKFFFRGAEAYDAIYEFSALKSGKKIEWVIEAHSHLDDLHHGVIVLRALLDNIREAVITKDSKKIKVNNGDVLISIDGFIQSHIHGSFYQTKPAYYFMRTLIDKFVYMFWSFKWDGTVNNDGRDLFKRITSFFNLQKYKYE